MGGRAGVTGETDMNDIYIYFFRSFLPLLPAPVLLSSPFPFICARLLGFRSRPVVDLSGEKAKPFPTR